MEEPEGGSTTAGPAAGADDQVPEEKLERARRNKERALELRKSRNRAHPYSTYSKPASTRVTPSSVSSLRDSHAGYIIEDVPTEHTPVYRVGVESGKYKHWECCLQSSVTNYMLNIFV